MWILRKYLLLIAIIYIGTRAMKLNNRKGVSGQMVIVGPVPDMSYVRPSGPLGSILNKDKEKVPDEEEKEEESRKEKEKKQQKEEWEEGYMLIFKKEEKGRVRKGEKEKRRRYSD